MDDSIGKTYELEGPHVHTLHERLEIIFDKLGKISKANSFHYGLAHRFFRDLPHH